MQALLEAIELPYTGSDPARVHALHGQGAREVPDARGRHPDAGVQHVQGERRQGARRRPRRCRRSGASSASRSSSKPASGGSALGVKFAREERELPGAIVGALSYDGKVVLERYIEGRDLAVSVLDAETPGGEPAALPIVEAVPRDEDFYDYESRYEIGMTTFVCPAELPAGDDRARAGARAARLRAARLPRRRARRPDARDAERRADGARDERRAGPDRNEPAAACGGRGGDRSSTS